MTLQQWLEIQGAKAMDTVVKGYPSGLVSTWTHPNNRLDVDKYTDEQLYRLIDGELKRIDQPIITCRECGKHSLWLQEEGWKSEFTATAYKDSVCPDCQAKQVEARCKAHDDNCLKPKTEPSFLRCSICACPITPGEEWFNVNTGQPCCEDCRPAPKKKYSSVEAIRDSIKSLNGQISCTNAKYRRWIQRLETKLNQIEIKGE